MNDSDVTGININPKLFGLAQCRKKVTETYLNKNLNCNLYNKSILDIDSNDRYDITWMEQAFHHIEPRKKIINKISSIVKPEGFIVLSEINVWDPLNQLCFFKAR